jgi:type III pantothenate kinase
MLLAIDTGNTTTHIGGFDGDRLIFSFRLASTHTRTVDEASLLLRQVLREHEIEPRSVDGAVMCSVVPLLTPVLEQAVRDACGVEPLVVTCHLKLPIRLDVPLREQVGTDRIANAVAFWTEHKCAGVVVDFGTATNFDVVSASGAYIGGALAPGLESAADRLAQKAAQLFKVGFGPPETAIGSTTEEALRSGFYYGAVGSVDEIVTRITKELDGNAYVVATGGLAEIVARESRTIRAVDPILTLKGLRYIAAQNLSAG